MRLTNAVKSGCNFFRDFLETNYYLTTALRHDDAQEDTEGREVSLGMKCGLLALMLGGTAQVGTAIVYPVVKAFGDESYSPYYFAMLAHLGFQITTNVSSYYYEKARQKREMIQEEK